MSVLRAPDRAFGATERTAYRFEEPATAASDGTYAYKVGKDSAKVIVYPAGAPVKYLKLPFGGDMRHVEAVYGD